VLAALHDPALVLVSLAVVLALVFGARAAGARGVAPLTVRKSLHAAIGLWTVLITPHVYELGWALVPPLVFLGANVSGKTASLAPDLTRSGGPASARGLWTFPLGVALTYLFFWEEAGRSAILAGCGALALADPIAASVGARWGQRRLHPLGHGRTLEGTLAFFLVCALVVGWIASRQSDGVHPWRLAIGCGAIGAAVEALSPPGWDNLSVPVLVAAAYRFLA
jgi:dolichol kinase